MKRLFLITLAVLLLAGIGVVVWTVVGLPPVRMVWSYGFSYGPEPTGRTLTVEGVEFVEIGPGCFLMGSDKNAEGGDLLGRWCARAGLPWGDQPEQSDEMPVHWVGFQRGFWVARTEVTNEQYEAFDPMRRRNSFFPGDQAPRVDLDWKEAKKYCSWLSERFGYAIRLPSESEWECACRAGSRAEFCFGNDETHVGRYAWYDDNSDRLAHEAGTRRANVWGLHDFHGNVWEWCEDAYHESYENASSDGTAWNGSGGQYRVFRGGCFLNNAASCRSANRTRNDPGLSVGRLGFRPAFCPTKD